MQSATVTTTLKSITAPLIKQLPTTAHGTDMLMLMGKIIDELPDETRLQLRDILDSYLLKMKKNQASDIDIGGYGCDGKIWYRIFGDKKPLKQAEELSLLETDFLLLNILVHTQRDRLLKDKNLDFSHSIELSDNKVQRFRVDMYFDLEHIAMNMRIIDHTIRPFKSLGVHPEIAKALSLKYYKYGLTLITGITGSGKSSTLDTIIDANNRTVDAHIVVISSPVELIHTPIRSIVRHKIGRASCR